MMRTVLVVAALLAALVMGGCGKDRIVDGFHFPPASPYPKLLNSYSVLYALSLAYVARDSTEIALLFDDAYQGTSTDNTDPAPTTAAFSKADEVAHVAALKRTALFGVTMLLTPSSIQFTDVADPPGWVTIQNPIATLEVSDSLETRRVDIPNETMEFKFVPTTPAPTSPTDTTWKIIRWSEVRN